MSEHEIFNSDEDMEISKNNSSCLKSLFSMKFLPYVLSVIALIIGFINKTVAWFEYDAIAIGVLFLFSFGIALGAFIIALINHVKNKENKINLQLAISIITVAILAVLI